MSGRSKVGGISKALFGTASPASAFSQESAGHKNGTPFSDTPRAICDSHVRTAGSGFENSEPGAVGSVSVGQSTGSPLNPEWIPSKPAIESPAMPPQLNAARATIKRTSSSKLSRETPKPAAAAAGFEKSNPPGGGNSRLGIVTVVGPVEIDKFEIPAFHFMPAPGDQSRLAAKESAERLRLAICGIAGIGVTVKMACCPAKKVTFPLPVLGKSNASSSEIHCMEPGERVAVARTPIRSCCASAAAPPVCAFHATSSSVNESPAADAKGALQGVVGVPAPADCGGTVRPNNSASSVNSGTHCPLASASP